MNELNSMCESLCRARKISKIDYGKLSLPVQKSNMQKTLENNGCAFNGQERLDNHELGINKECYCGRPFLHNQKG